MVVGNKKPLGFQFQVKLQKLGFIRTVHVQWAIAILVVVELGSLMRLIVEFADGYTHTTLQKNDLSDQAPGGTRN